jgi:hypothetical protein
MLSKSIRRISPGARLACILWLAFAFGACATRPPVVVICEPPDPALLVNLEFPATPTLGELEDQLTTFVRETLPLDNARKDEMRRQIIKLRQ